MTNGNIKVVEPVDDYKKIHKSIIKNKNIDCTTLGIYVKIVVLGVEWQLNIKGLASVLDLSDAKVRKSIGILEREGYIKRIANHHNGKLDGWIYEVYPMPLEEMQRSNAGYAKMDGELDFQSCAEFSVTENQTTLKSDNTENGEDNNIRPYIIEDLKNNKTYNNKKEKELKEKSDALFEECWNAYRRKGKKGKAYPYWKKLSEIEKTQVLPHIRAYVQTRDLQYQQDFERYLRDKTFMSLVFKNSTVIYDPTRLKNGEYAPQGRTIWFNEDTKSYWSLDNFYDERIYDGYDDENRPDGAEITLNNGRGTYVWNTNNKKWIKK